MIPYQFNRYCLTYWQYTIQRQSRSARSDTLRSRRNIVGPLDLGESPAVKKGSSTQHSDNTTYLARSHLTYPFHKSGYLKSPRRYRSSGIGSGKIYMRIGHLSIELDLELPVSIYRLNLQIEPTHEHRATWTK